MTVRWWRTARAFFYCCCSVKVGTSCCGFAAGISLIAPMYAEYVTRLTFLPPAMLLLLLLPVPLLLLLPILCICATVSRVRYDVAFQFLSGMEWALSRRRP